MVLEHQLRPLAQQLVHSSHPADGQPQSERGDCHRSEFDQPDRFLRLRSHGPRQFGFCSHSPSRRSDVIIFCLLKFWFLIGWIIFLLVSIDQVLYADARSHPGYGSVSPHRNLLHPTGRRSCCRCSQFRRRRNLPELCTYLAISQLDCYFSWTLIIVPPLPLDTSHIQVEVQVAPDSVEPGKAVDIIVKSKPNSYVGVLGVDQSVLLLKTGNDITRVRKLIFMDAFGVFFYRGIFVIIVLLSNLQQDVMDEVRSYDSTRRPDYTSWYEDLRGRSSNYWWPSASTTGEVFSVRIIARLKIPFFSPSC